MGRQQHRRRRTDHGRPPAPRRPGTTAHAAGGHRPAGRDRRGVRPPPHPDLGGRGIRARLTVTNVGDADGETVVQLYARDEAAAVVRPVRQLLDFARVAVPAGRTAHVAFDAPLERLFYTMIDGRRGIEAGDVTI